MKILRRPAQAPNEIEAVARLKRNVDLGMHMAERLAHMGETGAAAAVVGEVAREVRQANGALPGPRRSVARRRLSRSTVVGVSFVAALGAGSAAAIVTTQPPAPDARVRIQEPVFEPVRQPVGSTDSGDAVEETGVAEDTVRASRASVSRTSSSTEATTAEAPDVEGEDPPDGGWKLPIDPPEIDPPNPLDPDGD